MCVLGKHDKEHYMCSGLVNSLVGITLTNYYTPKALKLLGITINFVESWLKTLEKLYLEL